MKHFYTFLLVANCALTVLTTCAQPCSDNVRTYNTSYDWKKRPNNWNWTTPFFNDAYIKNRSNPSTIASPFYNPNTTFQNQNIMFLQNPATKEAVV